MGRLAMSGDGSREVETSRPSYGFIRRRDPIAPPFRATAAPALYAAFVSAIRCSSSSRASAPRRGRLPSLACTCWRLISIASRAESIWSSTRRRASLERVDDRVGHVGRDIFGARAEPASPVA